MKQTEHKHPLAIRWFHWINFPVLAVMIWSGILIYWANDIYKISIGNTVLFRFFPNSFYKALDLEFQLAKGMAFHFAMMWIFVVNGIMYVLYTILSGEWRFLVPKRSDFKDAWLVLLHDLHIRKTTPPRGKYNAAQKIAYTAIIVMGIGSFITGLAIYKPVQLSWLCALCGGYETARQIHFLLTVGYVLFFLVHIVQVALAGWQNFSGMVRGFEVKKTPENESGDIKPQS